MAGIRISRTVSVPEDEIELSFARSGGPGGQHVNTSATKVALRWDLERSAALTERQRTRVRRNLAQRLTKEGILILSASGFRSQTRNRDAVIERFRGLLSEALKVPRERKPTMPSKAARERRLEDKRHHAEKKALRKPPGGA